MPYKWLIILGFFLVLPACEPAPSVLNLHAGPTMGTQFSIQWGGPDEISGKKISTQIENRLQEINQSMSTYAENSEISLFNRLPVQTRFELSNDFANVIHQALDIANLTQGAFDFTIGPLVNLWGFGPNDGAPTRVPGAAQIKAAKERTGYGLLKLDESGLQMTKRRQTYLDLSAIAKGYAVDEIAELFKRNDIHSFLIEVGGELRASGEKPGGKSWRVGIEAPHDGRRDIQLALDLQDMSVATSGDYRNYFELDGVRYSHTIDPRTAYPIRHGLASVTVLSASCARADALATALMVMGPEKGMQFAEQQEIAAYFLIKNEDDDGFDAVWSEGFGLYLP